MQKHVNPRRLSVCETLFLAVGATLRVNHTILRFSGIRWSDAARCSLHCIPFGQRREVGLEKRRSHVTVPVSHIVVSPLIVLAIKR